MLLFFLEITFKTSNASAIKFNGTSKANNSTGTYTCGNYSISGSYGSGYEFSSWSRTGSGGFTTSSSSTSTSASSSTASTYFRVQGTATIMLAGKSIPYMQNMSSSDCTTTAKTVYDSRDNNAYLVQKLSDDKCWMLDNLRLDLVDVSLDNLKGKTNATDTILTYLKSGGSSSPYPSSGVTKSSWSDSYSLPFINVDSASTKTTSYGSGSGYVGVYYNYCAASAGSYCLAFAMGWGDASYDICPTGWRMPAGGSAREFQTLCTAAWGSACSGNNMFMAATNPKSIQAVLSITLSGSFVSGQARNLGSYGYFWTSAYSAGSGMDRPSFGASEVSLQGTGDRSSGGSIRCILK